MIPRPRSSQELRADDRQRAGLYADGNRLSTKQKQALTGTVGGGDDSKFARDGPGILPPIAAAPCQKLAPMMARQQGRLAD